MDINNYVNDKYFRGFVDYNKELIPHKSSFFRDSQDFSFLTFLNELSYNLNFNTSNYRFGIRYFNLENKDFVWSTSNDKKEIPSIYYSKEERKLVQYMKKAYFTNEQIESHFLGCLKPKRKYSKYNNIPELQDYTHTLQNIYKCDKKIFGSSQQIGSDLLLVDIDDYKDKPAIRTFEKFLEILEIDVSDLMFLEQNALKGGIHCIIKLPVKVSDTNFYSSLIEDFKNKGVKIECNFINTIIRFPLSFEYVAINRNKEIFNTDRFIHKDYWTSTFKQCYEEMNKNVCNSPLLNEKLLNTKPTEKNPFHNHWKRKKNLFCKDDNNSTIKFQEFYTLTYGNRFELMSKIIPYAKMQGFSLDETVELLYNQNESSKDLIKWSRDKLKKNITKFYNKCNLSPVKLSGFNSFVSNLHFLPEVTLDFLNSDSFGMFVSKNIINEINKSRKYIMSKEKQAVLYKQLPYMIKEIIGKMFYDISDNNTKRFINSKYDYYKGFQLSDSYISSLQNRSIEVLGLDKELGKTSIQYLKKAILKTIKLQEIKSNSHTRNWINGSCKSHKIRNKYELYSLLTSLYNRSNIKQVVKQSIQNNNPFINLIILNILLNRNIDLSDQFMIDHLKYNLRDDIPPLI